MDNQPAPPAGRVRFIPGRANGTYGGVVDVDPDALRAFGTQVTQTSQAVADAHLADAITGAGRCIPGSTTAYTAALVGEGFVDLVDTFARHLDAMGAAVRGSANNYVAQDTEVATALSSVWKS